MKKILGLALTAALTAGMLVGCGKDAVVAEEGTYLGSIDLEKYVTNLGEYKGLELSATPTEITDEDVELYIEYMLENSKQPEEVTGRPVQEGDVVNINYVGKKDGVAFEGGTADNYDLEIGSNTFIDGFEEGLIGCNTGDVVDLNLTFPEQYHSAELAGQAVVFTVTVNRIGELKVPELDEEYVASLGIENCSTVEEFREVVRQSLLDTADATLQNDLQTQAINALMENCEFVENPPEGLYNYYRDRIYENFEYSASSIGMTMSDFVTNYYGMTEEEFEEEISIGAKNSTNQAMACALVAKKEGIEVSDDELDEYIEANYANFGFESADAYRESGNAEDYRDYLLTSKVLEFLVDNANVTEVAVEATTEVATEAATDVAE